MPPATPSRPSPRTAVGTFAALAWLAAVQPVAAPVLVLAAWSAADPSQAHAQSRSRSSGGYSRPSSGSSSYSRTPSFSASPRPSAPRTPSFSGGYGLPSREPRGATALPFGGQSAGDRAFSRERSREAFGSYRAQREAPALPPRQWDAPSQPYPQQREPSQSGSWFGDLPSFSAPRRYARPAQPAPDPRAQWYGQQGWSAPPLSAPLPAYGAGRSFGVWDGLFLWSLLSNLGRPGATDFFHNHRDDEGYRAWRTEADRLAQENAEVRRRLEELDGQLAEKEGQPKDPNYLPPDVPPAVAVAPSGEWEPDEAVRTPSVAPASGGGSGGGFVLPVVLAGAGVLGFLAWQRRRSGAVGANAGAAMLGAAGGASGMRSGTNSPLQAAGAMLRHKLSGEGYAPQRFRVGMTLQLDPTPFILAADAIKLRQPDGAGQVSVKAVGRADAPGGTLVRLYLPDDRSMVQLVASPAGEPEESRLFGTIDEVAPADAEEWGVWLDDTEGLIGWPEFQTKDGKVYARAWSPGGSRVEPRLVAETIEGLDGTRTVQSRAMLYAAPTGAAEPAPQTEYILVAAVDDGRQAWVEIRSGIDLNPATLQLA